MERRGFSISSIKLESGEIIFIDASIYLSQKIDRKFFFSLKCSCVRERSGQLKLQRSLKDYLYREPRSSGDNFSACSPYTKSLHTSEHMDVRS